MPASSSKQRFQSLPWCCIGLIGCALSLPGCNSPAESHEDEHMEHVVPAHKPNSFDDMVEQLALRAAQLARGGGPSGRSHEGRATAMNEFADIVDWIPELAADSELMKADFDSAIATGNKIRAAFSETTGPQKTTEFEMATFEPLIDELRRLVPQSRNRQEQM